MRACDGASGGGMRASPSMTIIKTCGGGFAEAPAAATWVAVAKRPAAARARAGIAVSEASHGHS